MGGKNRCGTPNAPKYSAYLLIVYWEHQHSVLLWLPTQLHFAVWNVYALETVGAAANSLFPANSA